MTHMAEQPYRGRRVVLATQHGKEKAVAPAFSSVLGIEIVVPPNLDTDALGTFTRDVPRPGTMRETARRKAWLGIETSGLPLAIASEGSFGPHPGIPFLPAGHELLIFIDTERGLEIVEERACQQTNLAALDMTPGADLEGFLRRAQFPSHALVVRAGNNMAKGVASRSELERLLRQGGAIRLETDMRAHVNPTRMSEIAMVAERLARRLATPCPRCCAPGFGIIRSERGLVCGECGTPTQLVSSLVAACSLCGHETHMPRSDGRTNATSAECPECNP